MPSETLGLIGLGNMGAGMAKSLLRAGFHVVGTDINPEQRTHAVDIGVDVALDIATLCQRTQTIILSLPTAQHVQQVIMGDDGILSSARSGTIILDTSTSEPQITQTLSQQLTAHAMHLLDCPVSGGPAGAKNGAMVMLIGGDQQQIPPIMPVIEALTSKHVYLGPSGSGHAAKLINNLLCAAHLITTAEAVSLGQQLGLAPENLLEGINAGSGRSAVSEVNFPQWILNGAFDSGFTMQLMRKDVRLAQALIKTTSLQLPLAEHVAQQWAESAHTLADSEDFNRITHLSQAEDK